MASSRLFTVHAARLLGHHPLQATPRCCFQASWPRSLASQARCQSAKPVVTRRISRLLYREASSNKLQSSLSSRSLLRGPLRSLQHSARQHQAVEPAVATEQAGQHDPSDLPRLTTPGVSTHLFVIAGLVFSIVVVGGLTRLTESGLSITEWNLVTGTLPPLSQEHWESEYNRYMVTPEGTLMNKEMTLEEFKRIYAWEWGHRFLGRIIGIAFLAPIPYFLYKKKVTRKSAGMLFAIATLIGGQGALGWYMVKSGLTHKAIQARDGVPRVSQYRLAAHLGMAFLVYALALRHALSVRRDWNLAKLGKAIGGKAGTAQESLRLLRTPQANRTRVLVAGLTGLVFVTAISGAFVAGLDAGLLYNTFPYMGDRIIPPAAELYSPKYSRSPDQSDLYLRNSLENPTTVQFDHRALATTTFTAILSLFLYVRRPSVSMHIPQNALRAIKGTMHMALLQVALGISTLVYLVPIPLAAAHQAGSLVLLSLCVAAGAALRRPSASARQYIQALSTLRPAAPRRVGKVGPLQ